MPDNCDQISSTFSTQCARCTSPYVRDESDACITCSSFETGCNKCENGPVCTGCESGYAFDSDDDSCWSCQSSTIKGCLECFLNFPPSSDSFNCTKCANSKIPVRSGQECAAPIENCQTMDLLGDYVCKICDAGYIPSETGESCVSCSEYVG